MIGAEAVDVEAGGGSLKRDEVVGVASRSALRSSKPVLFGGCFVEVDCVFLRRDVVDNERREDVSPLNDVLIDMLGVCIVRVIETALWYRLSEKSFWVFAFPRSNQKKLK
jgi:hypothetical protein